MSNIPIKGTTTQEKILTSNDVDKSLIEQDLKIFELESIIEQLKRQLKYTELKMEDLLSQLTIVNEEKQCFELKLNETIQNKFSDLNCIKNENDSIKQKMQEDNEKMQMEIFFLKECINELEKQRDEYAYNFQILKNEKIIEQMNFEKSLEQLKLEIENIENDRKRTQEELEILTQTYNFETHEINQIKNINQRLEEKVII